MEGRLRRRGEGEPADPAPGAGRGRSRGCGERRGGLGGAHRAAHTRLQYRRQRSGPHRARKPIGQVSTERGGLDRKPGHVTRKRPPPDRRDCALRRVPSGRARAAAQATRWWEHRVPWDPLSTPLWGVGKVGAAESLVRAPITPSGPRGWDGGVTAGDDGEEREGVLQLWGTHVSSVVELVHAFRGLLQLLWL